MCFLIFATFLHPSAFDDCHPFIRPFHRRGRLRSRLNNAVFFVLNNEAGDRAPKRISETLVSCRDLIRRQASAARCSTSARRVNRCAGSSQQSNYAFFVTSQHVHMLFVEKHASALLHPSALRSRAPAKSGGEKPS